MINKNTEVAIKSKTKRIQKNLINLTLRNRINLTLRNRINLTLRNIVHQKKI